MPSLNCNADKCIYNIRQKCTKTIIRVGDCYKSGERQAECKSFKEDTTLYKHEFAKDCCDNAQKNVAIICDSKDYRLEDQHNELTENSNARDVKARVIFNGKKASWLQNQFDVLWGEQVGQYFLETL